MQKKVLSVDWFEVCCDVQQPNLLLYEIPKGMRVVREEYSTRHFRNVFQVSYYDRKVCTIVTEPFSQVMTSTTCLLKVDNKLLYSNRGFELVDRVFSVFGLVFRSTTRIDLCCDFTSIVSYNCASEFISDVLFGNVYKSGRWSFSVQGSSRGGFMLPYNYIRFGNTTSPCSIALYNKSYELQESKKTYIEDMWIASGLVDPDTLTLSDVWRLEFRITDSRYKFVNTSTGVVERLDPFRAVRDYDYLCSIYQALFAKNWDWRLPSDTDTNKSRWACVSFFDWSDKPCQHIRFVDRAVSKSNRTDKIVLRRLSSLFDEAFRRLPQTEKVMTALPEPVAQLRQVVLDFAYHNGLEDYYLNRISGYLTEDIIRIRKDETYMVMYQRMRSMFLSPEQLQRFDERRPLSIAEFQDILREFQSKPKRTYRKVFDRYL